MTDLNTLSDLLNLSGWRDDLDGPRTRGSTTELSLNSLPSDRVVTEFRPPSWADVPAARYFRVEAPELNGKLGAVTLGDLTPDQRKLLRIRDAGTHALKNGFEFYLDVDLANADLVPVEHVTVIVGPVEGSNLGWWTWFPGDVVGVATADGKVSDHPISAVGVKLHNG